MTLSADDKTRFLEALRNDHEFLQQVRQRVLTTDLLELPERFAAFASMVTSFIEAQREINARVDRHLGRVDAHLARVDEHLGRVDTRLQQITDDLGDLKGHVAGRVLRENADDIAEHLGFEIVETLNGNDLRRMLRQNNPTDIAPGDRASFYLADLVAKVTDQAGDEFFLAAEASYTADRRDTDRAIRNAQFLTRFTGAKAVSVIASRENDHDVARLVNDRAVLWFQFEQRHLTPR